MQMMSLAQSTRHAVSARLVGSTDRGVEIEKVLTETLRVYLMGLTAADPEAVQGAREAARGAMTALVLADAALPLGALAVLRATVTAATANGLDPVHLVTGALEGIADIRRIAPAADMALIQLEIEQEFMGTGEVMRKILEKAEMSAAMPLL